MRKYRLCRQVKAFLLAETRQIAKWQTQLDECREYHDRLHQYSQKNISFDLDDGVVKNYALFGDVVAKLK